MHTHHFDIFAGLVIYDFLLYFMHCSGLLTPADCPEGTGLVALDGHFAICWALPGLMEAATVSTCLPCRVAQLFGLSLHIVLENFILSNSLYSVILFIASA